MFPGSETQLYMKQRYKIVYQCTFQMTKFPFDQHRCNFVMKIEIGRYINNSILFTKKYPAVLYEGPSTWNQFEIINPRCNVSNNFDNITFIFSIGITRLYMNQMLNVFLPTMLLWSLAYFTLFIDVEFFSDRFIGTITTLLVQVALLSSINEDLPKTSYFKFIDLWFLWYISSILFITIFHIFINHIPNKIRVTPFGSLMIGTDNEQKVPDNLSWRMKANKLGIIIFAPATIIFNIVYFHASV